MKALSILLILALNLAAGAQEIDKCEKEHARAKEIKSVVEKYKKECGHYPSKLAHLVEFGGACKVWGKKGRYLADTGANRELLNGYEYKRTGTSFTLKPLDCATN